MFQKTVTGDQSGLGLRSAQRTREAAYWASWSDTLPMIHARHPVVANLLVRHLDGDSWSPSLRAASQAATELDGLHGFEVPSWSDVAGGLRPPDRDPEDHEPGGSRKGWQHEASSRVEQDFRESLFTRMPPSDRALVRSQSGPGAGVAFSASPSSMLTRIEAPLFRVLVQRRLRLPLPLSQRICGCGLSIDPLGHHRAACFALESALARVCREAGGRVATNLFVRNMDLGVPRAGDNRRLEVVVDGLPLFGGAQLAVDTTLVSALKANGKPRRGAADRDGVALAPARRIKERTYPELLDPGRRARLVVFALEVGGRWSDEAKIFILARARVRSEPRLLQRRLEQAWRLRWYAIISCAAARSFAASLLGLRGGQGSDGQMPPSHEVERDHAVALSV